MSGYSSVVQQRNPELVDILRTDFQHRNEPNFAWKSAVSATLALPGVIASWPMSVIRLDNAADRVRDIAGGGYHLTWNGGLAAWNDDLVPYVWFNGTTGYLSRVAGAASWASVRGNEAHIAASIRGLTMGGWIWTDTIAAGQAGLITKYTAGGNQRSWLLRRNGAAIQWYVSVNGIAALGPATLNVAASAWYCIVARWIPDGANSILKLWVNGETNENDIGAAATIFDSTADFLIGAYDGAANFLDGQTSLGFLCQCAVSDAAVFSFFQQSRAMFGV